MSQKLTDLTRFTQQLVGQSDIEMRSNYSQFSALFSLPYSLSLMFTIDHSKKNNIVKI